MYSAGSIIYTKINASGFTMPPNTVGCIYSIRRNRELQRRLIYDTEMLNNIPHLLTGKHNILWNGTHVLSFTFQIAKARLTTYFHIILLVVSIQIHCNLTPKHKSQYVLLKPIALVNTIVKVKKWHAVVIFFSLEWSNIFDGYFLSTEIF